MITLFLDTNLLVLSFKKALPLFDELERLLPGAEVQVIDNVVTELQYLSSSSKGADARAAALALTYLKQKHLKVVHSSLKENADDSLVRLSVKGNYVGTMDKTLQNRLSQQGVKIVTWYRYRQLIIKE